MIVRVIVNLMIYKLVKETVFIFHSTPNNSINENVWDSYAEQEIFARSTWFAARLAYLWHAAAYLAVAVYSALFLTC